MTGCCGFDSRPRASPTNALGWLLFTLWLAAPFAPAFRADPGPSKGPNMPKFSDLIDADAKAAEAQSETHAAVTADQDKLSDDQRAAAQADAAAAGARDALTAAVARRPDGVLIPGTGTVLLVLGGTLHFLRPTPADADADAGPAGEGPPPVAPAPAPAAPRARGARY